MCLRYLSRREYSRQELLQRLKNKGFSDGIPVRVLDQLAESGEQSDRRFADSLLRRRVSQGYGFFRIRAELRQRGIDDELVDATGYDWDAVLEQAHHSKYGARDPGSPTEAASRRRYLLQRGFSGEQIQRLFRHVHGEADVFD